MVINRDWEVAETLFADAKALTLDKVAQALVEVGDLKKATEAANQAMEVAKTIQYVEFMLGRHWVFKVLQEQADRREYP